jgi:putative toxin-antitoxin system antitoxin component (TIGR02293 family)
MTTDDILGASLSEDEPLKLMDELKAGLPSKALDTFKASARLSDDEIAEMLQVGARTLTRTRASQRKRLPADLSDRLFAIASVYALAIDVFHDRSTAFGWLNEPQFAFRGRIPRKLLSSELGRREVASLLQRIEHGMLA